MSDNADRSQVSKSPKYGVLGVLTNNPLATNPNESQQPEPNSNELMTHIINDASKIAIGITEMNNIDNSNLNRSKSPNQIQTNGDYDNEDIQNKMNGVISDFRSPSITPNDETLSHRKSITSGRLIDDQANSSTPAIIDPPLNNTTESPVRAMSASALGDHRDTERSSPLPIQQDESSLADEDISTTSKNIDQNQQDSLTMNDSQRPSSTKKQDGLDETTRFNTASPKPSTSRVQSPSTSGDEKPVQLPDETSTNQELETVAQRASPINRPRTPTPDDSSKILTNVEPQRPQTPFVGEQAQPSSRQTSPKTTKDDTNILIVDQSPSLNNQEQEKKSSTSRPNSTRSNDFLTTSEESKLIKPGEQLQLPTDDIDNKRINSPPPTHMALVNQSLGDNSGITEQEQSQLSNEADRKSPTSSSISNEKMIDGDVISTKSRRNSNISQQQRTSITDQKPTSGKKSNADERRQSVADQQEQKPSSKSSSRKTSVSEQKQNRPESRQQTNTNQENEPSSPRRSNVVNTSSSQQSSRRSSAKKQEQQTPAINNKDSSRRSSTDADVPVRTSAKQKQERTSANDKRQSPIPKSSEQKTNLVTDETVVTPIRIDSTKSREQNEKRLSTTGSDSENTSKLPRVKSSSQNSNGKQLSSSRTATPTEADRTSQWTKQVPVPPIQLTDDEIPPTKEDRPQSPNVEQIAERNQTTPKKQSTADGQKKKEQQRPLRRSTSAESTNHIQIVDDRSLGSTSDNNTESEQPKRRQIRSKKKDVQTSTDRTTDTKNNTNKTSTNGNYQQQQESTSGKPLKATTSMSNHLNSTGRRASTKEQTSTTSDSTARVVRRSVKQSKDSNEDPVNVNVTVVVKNINSEDNNQTSPTKIKTKEQSEKTKPLIDYDRHTQSDTEQIITEKQKKRRKPKYRSHKTQTDPAVFRNMERKQRRQHKELLPTSDTDKNIQTRESQLRPRTKSPRKHFPIYLSTDAFKIEEILPKQFPHAQQNITKTSVMARNVSPQGGKLLILRPSLPLHHTDAVQVQRICLQYAIDLIPNDSTSDQRNKSNLHKQPEQTNNLPLIRSSSTTGNVPINKSNTKEKAVENRTYQRKYGGAV